MHVVVELIVQNSRNQVSVVRLAGLTQAENGDIWVVAQLEQEFAGELYFWISVKSIPLTSFLRQLAIEFVLSHIAHTQRKLQLIDLLSHETYSDRI